MSINLAKKYTEYDDGWNCNYNNKYIAYFTEFQNMPEPVPHSLFFKRLNRRSFFLSVRFEENL